MATVILLSVLVPIAAGALFLLARPRVPRPAADTRGIALQTIIIIVVLLAIAGTVATVLLTRAGEETDRLEAETDRWSDITNETGCKIAGGRPGSVAPNAEADNYAASDADNAFVHCWPPEE